MTGASLRRISAGTLRIGALTLVVKALALGKEMALAQRFGTSAEFDAYVVALAAVFFLVNLVTGNFTVAFVPTYLGLPSEPARSRLAGRILGLMLMGGLGLTLGIWLFAGSMPALFPRLDASSRSLLPALLRGLAPLVALAAGGASLAATLQARERFSVPALAPGLTTLLVLMATLLYPGVKVIHIVTATLLGGVLEVSLLWGRLGFLGAGPVWIPLSQTVPGNGRVWRQYLPMLSGGLLMNSTALVDVGVAAWLPKGTVSAVAFAGKLPAVVVTLIATALGTAALPALSNQVAAKDWAGLRHVLRRGPLLLLAVTVPLVAAFMALSEPLARILFQRGAFTAENTRLVADIQTMYLLQVPFYAISILFMGTIAALGQNRILFLGAVISAGLNLGLDLLLVPLLGPRGIALSTVMVYVAACLFLGYHAHRLVHAEAPR